MENYKVTNRSAGMVVYAIPESNIKRQFAPGETKLLSLDELNNLAYQPGGERLLIDYLQVESAAVSKLQMQTEKEYNMSIEEVKQFITKSSMDEFLDALDFAPTGVIDLIKKFAVELPLTDMNKIASLKEKTGFDVLSALRNSQEDKTENQKENKGSGRRVKEEDSETPKRRVSSTTSKTTSKS